MRTTNIAKSSYYAKSGNSEQCEEFRLGEECERRTVRTVHFLKSLNTANSANRCEQCSVVPAHNKMEQSKTVSVNTSINSLKNFNQIQPKFNFFSKLGQNSKWALIERLDGLKLSCRKILEGEHDNIISLIWSRCACKVRDLLRLKSHTIIIEMLFWNSIWLSLFDFY